jgi:TetR/AcrR family transcriptional regulator, fatty acid biosynthesis regulator
MNVRVERKLHTRRALMDAALALMAGGRSFGALSLREVARAADVVPTAFYRHFRDMDELGLALVDETFATLRRLMREVRHTARGAREIAAASVGAWLGYMREHRSVFEFVARERHGGTPPVRAAIAREVRFFTSDLADDLTVLPALDHLDRAAREVVAQLIVSTVWNFTGDVLDVAPGADAAATEAALAARTVTQLIMITQGAALWKRPQRG